MTNEQQPVEKKAVGVPGGASGGPASRRKRVLWLHTQPEHYHNVMMDDLTQGTGYRVAGMADPRSEEFEYIAGFCKASSGHYANNQPTVAKTVILQARPGRDHRYARFNENYHVDWRGELMSLGIDVAIVSGYFQRTSRELIQECERRGIPVAMWSDSNLRSDRGQGLKMRVKRMLKRRFLRKMTASVDYLLTANRLGEAYWRYYGGAGAREKILICPCYSDYRRIDAARERPRAEVLATLGLQAEDRYIFSAARLAPVKGLDLLIQAFLAGGFGQRGWKYVVAGTGPMEAELKALAGEALGKSIFLLGFQQPAENLSFMAHAEVMALPSRFEPHGIVVGESLAAGTPVLLSDIVGGAAGLVTPGVNGLLFRSEDVEDLGRKLLMLEDRMQMQKLRAAARPSFEAWYRKTSPIRVVPTMVREMLGRVGGRA